jgi:hypothetical protein
MERSRFIAWGGPTDPISGQLTRASKSRAPAKKSLRTRRASTPEPVCRALGGSATRGAPWLAEGMGAVSAR